MHVLIATPLHHAWTGGPAQYAVHLERALEAKGHTVEVLAFSPFLKYWSGVRHIIFFWTLCRKIRIYDVIIILDTVSVALPTVLASYLFRKTSIVRTGGDFLWEQYIERTNEALPLTQFYSQSRSYSFKERCVFLIQKYIIFKLATYLVLSTEWQRALWVKPYALSRAHTTVIENAYIHERGDMSVRIRKNEFVWLGRDIVLKNIQRLRDAIIQVQQKYPEATLSEYTNIPHSAVFDILKESRALVIPSLSEVSPNIAIEALSLGVPVVLTKECGISNVLAQHVVWIDPLDVNDIKNALCNLMTDEGYESACARARRYASTRTYADVAEEFLILIQKIRS